MSGLKIAMLLSTSYPPEEGIGRYVHNLSAKLVEKGHHVSIITRGGMKAETLNLGGVVVFKVPFLMAYPFHVNIHGVFVNSLIKSLEGSLDLVHVHSPLVPAISACVPTMTTFHTPQFTDSYVTDVRDIRSFLIRVLGILGYRLERSLISSSRVVSAVSDGVALDLKTYYGMYEKKIVVLGNGVSDKFLEMPEKDLCEKDGGLVLYVSRLDYRKGVLDLVDSMKTVVRAIPSAKLVMIGKGPMLSELTKRIVKLGLQGHVQLKGFLSDEQLLKTFLGASVFVLPSHYEGLPTALLEAMACRVPVVATAVRGNLEVVKNERTGLLVPPKAPESLAKAIMYMLQNPDFGQELARNARQLVEEKFTWDRVAEKALSAYKDVMA